MKRNTESKKLAIEFESLCYDLFKACGYNVRKHLNINGKHKIDLLVENVQKKKKAIVELKLYRSKRISLDLVKKGLTYLQTVSEGVKVDSLVLIISTFLSKKVIKELEEEYGVIIWDKNNLYELTKDFIELHERLLEILRKSNQILKEDKQLFRKNVTNIEDIWHDSSSKKKSKDKEKNINYISELRDIPAGQDGWRDFEDTCYKILKYLFKNDLTGWHKQQKTNDGLNRFDLICRVTSQHDFWVNLSEDFNTRYVLFEFKNYKDKIKQGQVYTTEKYLFTTALRSVGFIISREGADDNALVASCGALKENGKLIIHLTESDLCEMLKRKKEGDDPANLLIDRLDETLISISR